LSYGGPNRAVATGDHNTRSGVRMLRAG